MERTTALVLWWIGLAASAALAGSAAGAGENQAVTTFVYPCRSVATPIRVDGKLDEPAWSGFAPPPAARNTRSQWSQAVEVSGFTFSGKGLLASEQMVMRLLYDRENLYLGVKCNESKMNGLVAAVRFHDGNVWNDDCIELFLDPTHDHETYYQFAVNSLGAQYDARGFDRMWNCQWQAAASLGQDAWYVEVAIPFAAFGLSTPAPDSLWGFNLNRERNAGGSLELYNWADVQANFHNPGLFGHLWFVDQWPPTESSLAAAGRRAGGAASRVYVADGYYEVKQGEKPQAFAYRGLIELQRGAIGGRLQELGRIYDARPEMALKDQFDQLTSRYESIKALATGDRAVSAEESAGANAFLHDMEGAVNDIYWRVRVKLLLETF
jgi:hypothetical protein